MRILAMLMTAIWLQAGSAWAVNPSEMLSDPAAEARAEQVGKGLRCLVCQSESIEESDADLARDLRTIVRERITAGDTNQQIVDFVVGRYGDYVLLNPPFKPITYLLWGGPILILILAVLLAVSVFRRRQNGEAPALSEDEKRHLKTMMERDKS